MNGYIYDTQNGRGGGNRWVYEKLKEDKEWYWKGVFFFKKKDLLSSADDPDDPVEFLICKKGEDSYFHIPRRFLDVNFDLFIHSSISISRKTFCTDDESVSIFKRLDQLVPNESIVAIGGSNDAALSEKAFQSIIESIPSKYEWALYSGARVDAVLKNYFETGKNSEAKLQKYLNKKINLKENSNLSKALRSYELTKTEVILNKLKEMLAAESGYSEKLWQDEILEIILLLYPKYIHAFKETNVPDVYSSKKRRLDILLVDSGGNIDIIEIKKPFDSSVVTGVQYRDNFIPMRELSGTVMQIEKYLFHLKGWGKKGEESLTEKYSEKLPKGFRIQITNPTGIIIMGREKGLSVEQLRDFEVIKRQYKNVVDIITYDDLIRRLEFTVKQLKAS